MASHTESIPDLIRGTIRDGLGLVRDEIFLVRTELREEIARIRSGLVTAVAAVVVGLLAVIMLLDAVAWGAVYAFDWPTWAGFAVVALPLVIIAVVLGVIGRSLLARDRYMPKSVDTLKENAEWIRARTQS
jgi:Putative Actinobacterial Holin-X, holin superfamily III